MGVVPHLGSDPIPRDDLLGVKLLGCFPRGYFVFYLVIEIFSSFSSMSYPLVRKRNDHCGMNMSTNIALKTRTRCYSFDQYVRKCNDSLFVNTMMAKKSFYFRTEWYLLCYCCCAKHPAHRNNKSRVPRCGARTRDHRREATLLLLVVLQSGAAVAVVWAHARTQELCL